jgi:hypothetical protein
MKQRRDRVAAAAQALYEEHHAGKSVPDSTIDDILGRLADRLKRACDRQLLPNITYTSVEFAIPSSSRWASVWGHAASLLAGIAQYPRKVLTDRNFLRRLDVDEDDLLAAMDVCGDAILKISKRRDARERARADLEVLARLAASGMGARDRCDLLLRLIGGAEPVDISAEIPDDPED